MPTYEYRCKKCGKTFEEFQSITAKPLKKCRYCPGRVERVIGTGGGFILKGSGFYSTDYPKAGYKEEKAKEKAGSCPAGKEGTCRSCTGTDKK